MSVQTIATTTWTCDRCGKKHEDESMPSNASDPWGKLMIDQPSGFDMGGVPWAPRMREPLVMCGACIETVVAAVNGKGRGVPDSAVCFFQDGNKTCAVHGDFINLQESPAGFGDNFEEALAELKKNH